MSFNKLFEITDIYNINDSFFNFSVGLFNNSDSNGLFHVSDGESS